MAETKMASMKEIDAAWERAATIRGRDPHMWRRDELGNEIRYGSYGTKGEYGWGIDPRKPFSRGGSDGGTNLRALHWQADREKGDD
jgi:hypothetical protein